MKNFNWFVSKYFYGEKYYWNGDGFTNDCLSAKFYYDRIDAGKIAKKYDGKVEYRDLIGAIQ